MKLALLIALALGHIGLADVCVRNYSGENNSPCKLFPQGYSTIENHAEVCVRVYSNGYCVLTPNEYRYVQASDGRKVCTVHYDQPTLVNLCDRYPQYYSYVPNAR